MKSLLVLSLGLFLQYISSKLISMLPLRPVLNTTIRVIRATRDAILPFTEQPPKAPCTDLNTGVKEERTDNEGINASDLFSLFTANIVKQDVVFTR